MCMIFPQNFQVATTELCRRQISRTKHRNSKLLNVKSISKSNLSQKSLKNLICEIQILAKLNHPNIVKYYETYDDEKYFYLVMELCEGGELFERIVSKKHLEEKDVAEILFN